MKFAEIIDEIQGMIISLQARLDELKSFDYSTAHDILLTRQEAADLMKKSLRQLDRDCARYGIPKENVNGGIRIRKSEILKFMGVLSTNDGSRSRESTPSYEGPKMQSEFDRIRNGA